MDTQIMDEEFKFWYVTCMFQESISLDPCWKQQVILLQDHWELLAQRIDRDDFYHSFMASCAQLHQPSHQYPLEDAFEKAKHEWKTELMLRVAHDIIYFNDENVPESCQQSLVFMDNGYIKVDTSLCPSFYIKTSTE